MIDRGEFRDDSSKLSLEEMQEALFVRGWEHTDSEYTKGWFERSYARVNPALRGDEWNNVVNKMFSVAKERAPYLGRGCSMRIAVKDTELELGIRGGGHNRDDVERVYIIDSYLRENGFEEIDEEMLAVWLKLKGEPGMPKIGSKAYYEQNPRSAELRLLGIEAIRLYTQIVAHEGIEGQSTERLMEINKKLADLAIEPQMHVGAPQEVFVDPVTRAEWAVGMVRDALANGYGFAGNARKMIQEHDVFSSIDGMPAVIDDTSEAAGMAITLMNLNALMRHLDPDADEDPGTEF